MERPGFSALSLGVAAGCAEGDFGCHHHRPGFPRVLGGRIDMGAIEADFDRLFADRFEDHSQ